jgi:hypothetical protein
MHTLRPLIHPPFRPQSSIIVSQSLSETTVCPQTFIVKTLIISNTDIRPIYCKQKEGARGLAAGETERESVCVRETKSS